MFDDFVGLALKDEKYLPANVARFLKYVWPF